MLMKSFFAIAIGCMLSISATAAQEAVPLGKAIGEGVDQRVDKRVDERLAQRQEAAPKANSSVPKAGDYANKSDRYAQYLAQCASGGMNASLRDETARRFDKMSPADFQQQLDLCPRAVQDRQLTIQAQAAARVPTSATSDPQVMGKEDDQEEVADDQVRPTPANYYPRQRQRQGRRPAQGQQIPEFAQIRKYLDNYRGPLMRPTGPHVGRHFNKMPPSHAKPCQPPGFNHVVLCVQRTGP